MAQSDSLARSIAAEKALRRAREYSSLGRLLHLPSPARLRERVCRVVCVAARNRVAPVLRKPCNCRLEAPAHRAVSRARAPNPLQVLEETRSLERFANIQRDDAIGRAT